MRTREEDEDDGSVYGRPSALIGVSSGAGRHLRCGLRSVAPVRGAAIVGLVDLGLLLHGAGLASLAWPTLSVLGEVMMEQL